MDSMEAEDDKAGLCGRSGGRSKREIRFRGFENDDELSRILFLDAEQESTFLATKRSLEAETSSLDSRLDTLNRHYTQRLLEAKEFHLNDLERAVERQQFFEQQLDEYEGLLVKLDRQCCNFEAHLQEVTAKNLGEVESLESDLEMASILEKNREKSIFKEAECAKNGLENQVFKLEKQLVLLAKQEAEKRSRSKEQENTWQRIMDDLEQELLEVTKEMRKESQEEEDFGQILQDLQELEAVNEAEALRLEETTSNSLHYDFYEGEVEKAKKVFDSDLAKAKRDVLEAKGQLEKATRSFEASKLEMNEKLLEADLEKQTAVTFVQNEARRGRKEAERDLEKLRQSFMKKARELQEAIDCVEMELETMRLQLEDVSLKRGQVLVQVHLLQSDLEKEGDELDLVVDLEKRIKEVKRGQGLDLKEALLRLEGKKKEAVVKVEQVKEAEAKLKAIQGKRKKCDVLSGFLETSKPLLNEVLVGQYKDLLASMEAEVASERKKIEQVKKEYGEKRLKITENFEAVRKKRGEKLKALESELKRGQKELLEVERSLESIEEITRLQASVEALRLQNKNLNAEEQKRLEMLNLDLEEVTGQLEKIRDKGSGGVHARKERLAQTRQSQLEQLQKKHRELVKRAGDLETLRELNGRLEKLRKEEADSDFNTKMLLKMSGESQKLFRLSEEVQRLKKRASKKLGGSTRGYTIVEEK